MQPQESIPEQELTPADRAELVQNILEASGRESIALDESWLQHFIRSMSPKTAQYWLEKVRDDPTSVVHRIVEMKAMVDSIDGDAVPQVAPEEIEEMRHRLEQITKM